jgi:hypothetical protein
MKQTAANKAASQQKRDEDCLLSMRIHIHGAEKAHKMMIRDKEREKKLPDPGLDKIYSLHSS